MNQPLNHLGQQLKLKLEVAASIDTQLSNSPKVNVANVGRVVSTAYEQLRNAAEYTQEHLLRQQAIRRFFGRNLSFHMHNQIDKSLAEEVVVELTQAGYIENDSQPYELLNQLSVIITKHYENYWRMRDSDIQPKVAEEWALDLLSVESEQLIAREKKAAIFVHFVHQHYRDTLDPSIFEGSETSDYDASLYVAVHRALLKSDLANVRYDLLQLYKYPDTDIAEYIQFNTRITDIFSSDVTDGITRYVDRHGAPLRILRAMIEERQNLPMLLSDDRKFIDAFETQVETEYAEARKRLNKGTIKSITFLLITKALIGLVIEIPYDLAVTGSIIILPLAINLLAPVLYLLLLRAGLKLPGTANTIALISYVKETLYSDGKQKSLHAKPKKKGYSVGFTITYVLTFLVAFGVVINRLAAWEFNIPQGILFFIFLATASFLGFRLSHTVRELELVTAKPGVIQVIRDFLYMPFIVLGRWLSERYRKVNIVALILDKVIELPLKTVLRLIRQWASFIGDKKDSL